MKPEVAQAPMVAPHTSAPAAEAAGVGAGNTGARSWGSWCPQLVALRDRTTKINRSKRFWGSEFFKRVLLRCGQHALGRTADSRGGSPLR